MGQPLTEAEAIIVAAGYKNTPVLSGKVTLHRHPGNKIEDTRLRVQVFGELQLVGFLSPYADKPLNEDDLTKSSSEKLILLSKGGCAGGGNGIHTCLQPIGMGVEGLAQIPKNELLTLPMLPLSSVSDTAEPLRDRTLIPLVNIQWVAADPMDLTTEQQLSFTNNGKALERIGLKMDTRETKKAIANFVPTKRPVALFHLTSDRMTKLHPLLLTGTRLLPLDLEKQYEIHSPLS